MLLMFRVEIVSYHCAETVSLSRGSTMAKVWTLVGGVRSVAGLYEVSCELEAGSGDDTPMGGQTGETGPGRGANLAQAFQG